MQPVLIRRMVAELLGVLLVAGLATPQVSTGTAQLRLGLASAGLHAATAYDYDAAGQQSSVSSDRDHGGTTGAVIGTSTGKNSANSGDTSRPGPGFIAAETADGAAM
jgi:hypothetical protein